MYKLNSEIKVPYPIETVYPFFNRPENLEPLTPKFLNFKILTPSPIEMRQGAIIDYEIKLFGIPMRWTTIINNYNPPNEFVDIQLKGPYSLWHHKHIFKPAGKNATLIIDELTYKMPFGILGKIAHFLFTKHMVKKIFTHRETLISKMEFT